MNLIDRLQHAVDWLREADGLLITAGAGMGVDSGLPDFRGTTGFWQAYPALGQAGMRFEDVASPAAFFADPRQAWGFYGHRLNLYRHTEPHAGYRILLKWAEAMQHGAFVFTSNVDGHSRKPALRKIGLPSATGRSTGSNASMRALRLCGLHEVPLWRWTKIAAVWFLPCRRALDAALSLDPIF